MAEGEAGRKSGQGIVWRGEESVPYLERNRELTVSFFPWAQFDQVCILERPLWLQGGRCIGDQGDPGLWRPVSCLQYESGSGVEKN